METLPRVSTKKTELITIDKAGSSTLKRTVQTTTEVQVQ